MNTEKTNSSSPVNKKAKRAVLNALEHPGLSSDIRRVVAARLEMHHDTEELIELFTEVYPNWHFCKTYGELYDIFEDLNAAGNLLQLVARHSEEFVTFYGEPHDRADLINVLLYKDGERAVSYIEVIHPDDLRDTLVGRIASIYVHTFCTSAKKLL